MAEVTLVLSKSQQPQAVATGQVVFGPSENATIKGISVVDALEARDKILKAWEGKESK